jgi:hypothetical protein
MAARQEVSSDESSEASQREWKLVVKGSMKQREVLKTVHSEVMYVL